jgi:hypothetical protein
MGSPGKKGANHAEGKTHHTRGLKFQSVRYAHWVRLKVEDAKVIFAPVYLGARQSFPPTVSKSTTLPRSFFERARI